MATPTPDEHIEQLRRKLRRLETPPLPAHTIPYSRAPFIHRPELDILEQKLSQNARVALVGPDGVGKSHLAIEYCYRLRERHPDTWVLWIRAGSAARFDEGMRKLANDVKIPGRHEKDADIFQLVRGWLTGHRWLIVLDGVEDFLHEVPVARNSKLPRSHYLPEHGKLLLTSRRAQVDSIELKPDKEHATRLLRHLLADERLAVALDYPFAIVQATAYIHNTRCTPETYIRLLTQYDEFPSWRISFEHIYQLHRSAAQLLSVMSFYDNQGIPEILVYDGEISAPGLHPTTTLQEFSLISVSQDGSFEMHRLVQLATQSWLKRKGEYQAMADQSVKRLADSFSTADDASCRALYPHAKLMIGMEVGSATLLSLATLLHQFATFALTIGAHLDAEMAASRSAEIRRGVLGEHTATLSSMSQLASSFTRQGRLADAVDLEETILKMSKKILGDEHPTTLSSMASLASIYNQQGRHSDAIQLGLTVLQTRMRVLGEEHPDTLSSMINQASYGERHQRVQSADLEERVVEIRKRVLGEEHPDTLSSMTGLASKYVLMHKFTEAAEVGSKVVEVGMKVLGEEHPDTLTSIISLATTYERQGNHLMVMSMNGLAATYERQESHLEAAALATKVLDVRQRILGEEHPKTLVSMNYLALVLIKVVGRHEDAAELAAKNLELTKKIYGPDTPSTTTSMLNLAIIYYYQQRSQEAISLAQACLDLRIKMYGPEHGLTKSVRRYIVKFREPTTSPVHNSIYRSIERFRLNDTA